MNIDRLVELLKEKKLYKKTVNHNIVSICPICGDHKNPSKRGHLYISTDSNKPIYHCFINNCTGNIRKLVLYLTNNNTNIAEQVISKDELKKSFKHNFVESKSLEDKIIIPKKQNIPKNKYDYIRKRCFYKIHEDLLDQYSIIYDLKKFFKVNKYVKNIQQFIEQNQNYIDNICDSNVAFLSKHKSILLLRNINNSKYKYFKLILYSYNDYLLDYFEYIINENSDGIVMAEGIFDIFGYMAYDKLKLRNRFKYFTCGLSFSYYSLLKSICFDHSLYSNNKVIILGDSDKPKYKYYKFIKNTKHIVSSLKIYNNQNKNDFGCYPNNPVYIL